MIEGFDFGALALVDLLSEGDVAKLERLARRSSYHDGQLVHERGDPDSTMCIVVKGAVRLVRRRADGQVIAVLTVKAGQHYGDTSAMNDVPRTHAAVAIGETQVDHFSRSAFDELIRTQPAVVAALYKVASYRLMVSIDLLDDARRLAPELRLAKIVQHSLRATETSERISCRQEDIAQMLGLSSVTVAKALATLTRANVLKTGYRYIEVPDITRLRDWVEANESD